jgi:hypothetical protein
MLINKVLNALGVAEWLVGNIPGAQDLIPYIKGLIPFAKEMGLDISGAVEITGMVVDAAANIITPNPTSISTPTTTPIRSDAEVRIERREIDKRLGRERRIGV